MGLGNDIFGIASIWSMISGKNTNTGTGSGTVLEVKTGPMITGYTHKVLTSPNFGKEQVEALKILSSVDAELKSDKETRVTPYSTETNATPVVKTTKGLTTTTITTPTNEFTKDAIKEQTKSKGWIDAIYGWIWWIITLIALLIFLIIIVVIRKFNKGVNLTKQTLKTVKSLMESNSTSEN